VYLCLFGGPQVDRVLDERKDRSIDGQIPVSEYLVKVSRMILDCHCLHQSLKRVGAGHAVLVDSPVYGLSLRPEHVCARRAAVDGAGVRRVDLGAQEASGPTSPNHLLHVTAAQQSLSASQYPDPRVCR
jgi:hypothetical protein